jgi:3-hydroxybutyryl-CoA dehydrogenase
MTSAAASFTGPRERTWDPGARAAAEHSLAGRVGIVGLGRVGTMLAELCVRAGIETVGHDLSAVTAQRARDRLERDGYWGDEAPQARLLLVEGLEELAGCRLVIECAGERSSVKRELIADLAATMPGDAPIATHTGRLSVTELAALAERPERVVGLHFPYQATASRLVEVIQGELTEPRAVAEVAAFVTLVGGQPLACPDTPGFVVDRVLTPMLNDCVRVLEETGVTPEALDAAVRTSGGWSLGPCALLDSIGIDVHVQTSESLYAAHREPRMAPPPRLVRMRRAGLLGRKSGRGFYSY